MRRIAAALSRRLLAAALLAALPAAAHAQLGALAGAESGAHAVSSNQPVTFTADQVEYDRPNSLVIARGHVEAWQNDHVLRADQITFDRNTGVAAAKGHVVLLEPDGTVLFADYAEMTQNMKQGVLKDMRALLAENGRLAANGARRTDGQLNEMSKAVYSTCNLCAKDPTRPPLWQVRASSAIQDLEHKRIEYEDAVLQMYGVPVAYFPFLSQPDPSVKRQSGILAPWFGTSSNIGGFFAQPYYLVLDDQSDATITPMITTRAGPELDVEYRRRFNNGTLLLNGSAGYIDNSPQGTIVARGQFNFNDTWRWGFDINRASSSDYVRDFHIGTGLAGDPNVLPSNIYAEGFGEGAYSRLDTRFYQGLSNQISNSQLPVVLPRYEYSYFGRPDGWGGRLSVDTGAFNVIRSDGTNTRRANLTLNWDRPFAGAYGDQWKVSLHGDAIAYDASFFNEQPNFGPMGGVTAVHALPQAAVEVRWPFARDSGSWGTQLIEPMLQLVVAPQSGDSQNTRYPNEDSLDLEFTDANLFGFNRFTGVDRLTGGTRLNAGLHGAWYLGGTTFDGLIGQAYQTGKNNLFPEYTGLHDQVSDIVARGTFAPANWLDLTLRARLDKNSLAVHWADIVGGIGVPKFKVYGGYIYSAYDQYQLFDQPMPPPVGSTFFTPRNEATLNVASTWGNYRFAGFARRDLSANKMVAFGGDAIYEDECFVFDLRFYRRYTSVNNDNGATTVMFLFTFKTIGQFGYRAL
ncbi:MAG TPA: LPS assembly protein LptD [Acetobacteraceae bacterium]|nr:LPS assembly protein LptD [Acetobacteraceae bacterium]